MAYKEKLVSIIQKIPFVYDYFYYVYEVIYKKMDIVEYLHNNIRTKQCNIIQIGANDGIRKDFMRSIIFKYGDNVLLFEPDPVAFKKLKKNYKYMSKRLNIINCFITPDNKNNNYNYYSLSDEARKSLSFESQLKISRKSSMNRDFFRNYLLKIGFKEPDKYISKQEINSKTINQVFLEYGVPDILALDTEAMDYHIVQSINFNNYKPKIIIFESRSTNDKEVINKLNNILETKDYSIKSFKNDKCCILNSYMNLNK